MKILFVTACMNPEWGGPVKVVSELSEHLSRKGINITIYSSVKKGKEKESIFPQGANCRLFKQNFLSKLWRSYSPQLSRSLKKEIHRYDVIHIHGTWHYACFIAHNWARKANKPYIITVHGTLEPWCLNYKRLKKKIFSILILRKILREAEAIQACTQSEAEQIRAFGINNRIVIIPNGIDIEQYQSLPSRGKFEEQYPEVKGKKMILFLSRIHPKKGLDILVKSFSNIAGSRDDCTLVIPGPGDEGYKKHIESMIKSEGISKKVIFTGMLTGKPKLAALSRADIFVLPSYSEGFSMAVLEALASCIPVIITDKCGFPEVAEHKSGIIIRPDIDELSHAQGMLLDNPHLRREMADNGRRLVKEKYTWRKVANKMIDLYKQILLNKL